MLTATAYGQAQPDRSLLPLPDIPSGGQGKLLVNDKLVAEGRIEATVPLGFTADETLDVGLDTGTPGADTYEGAFPFTGKIDKVTFELK